MAQQVSSWNHRLVRDEDGRIGLCEVFYNGDVPTFYAAPQPLTGETVGELRVEYDQWASAFHHPVLDAKDFASKEKAPAPEKL